MPRFFIDAGQISPDGTTALIKGEDARHISRSLRMRAGENLTLCDGYGTDIAAVISQISADTVALSLGERTPCESEAPYRAVVYQALVRGERFDAVIQKSVEFGAASIVPVATARSTVRLSAADTQKKLARWQRIAAEAAMQCGRGVIPAVTSPMTFDEAVQSAAGVRLFCYEEERTVHLRDALAAAETEEGGAAREVSVFIGPEGGFTPEEAETARASGAFSVSLGRRILRTESAAPFVLACLAMRWEK